jgi:hypothetical protein
LKEARVKKELEDSKLEAEKMLRDSKLKSLELKTAALRQGRSSKGQISAPTVPTSSQSTRSASFEKQPKSSGSAQSPFNRPYTASKVRSSHQAILDSEPISRCQVIQDERLQQHFLLVQQVRCNFPQSSSQIIFFVSRLN